MNDKPESTTKFAEATLGEVHGMLYNLAQEAETAAKGFDEQAIKIKRYERSVERAVAEAETRGTERAARIVRMMDDGYFYDGPPMGISRLADAAARILNASRSQDDG